MRYLLLTFVKKPNGQIDEQCEIANKLKKTDQATCNIILDYAERKIVKCVVEGKVLDTTWELINDYYSKVYPTLIEELQKSSPPITEQTQ